MLEYIEGETLKDRIRRTGPLPVPEAVAYAIEVGRALSAAHQTQLVHRDVKPQNVLIDPEGRAKLTDFGISRSLLDHGLTATGRVLGTTDYVSPEQALGEVVGEQSDVYSLGICLFEMLTGAVPFKAESQVGVAMKHVREAMPDVQKRRPEISAALASIVEKATAKELKNRYHDVDEMVADLEQALAIEVARSGPPDRRGDVDHPRPAARLARGAAAAAAQPAPVGADDRAGRHRDRADHGRRGRADREGQGADRRPEAEAAAGQRGSERPDHQGDELRPAARGRRARSIRAETQNAIDDDPSTKWSTENYTIGGGLANKPGVGLYLTAKEAVAATKLNIFTTDPRWDCEIYGAAQPGETLADWGQPIGARKNVPRNVSIELDTGGRQYRYYLIWITKLASEQQGGYRRGSTSSSDLCHGWD